jgi:hypothetical protein
MSQPPVQTDEVQQRLATDTAEDGAATESSASEATPQTIESPSEQQELGDAQLKLVSGGFRKRPRLS